MDFPPYSIDRGSLPTPLLTGDCTIDLQWSLTFRPYFVCGSRLSFYPTTPLVSLRNVPVVVIVNGYPTEDRDIIRNFVLKSRSVRIYTLDLM